MASTTALDPNTPISLPSDFFTGPQDLTTTSTSITDLPSWLRPYALELLSRAEALSSGPYPYPDQQVAGFTPATREGRASVMDAARRQQGLLTPERRLAKQTLRGDFLDPSTNPWLKKTYDAAATNVTDQYKYATAPTTAANMARAGTFGGSAMDQEQQMNQFSLGQNLNDLATAIYGGNYQQERTRQMDEQQLLPSILSGQFTPGSEMMKLGAQKQGQQQNVMNTQYQNAWNRANWPFQSLDFLKGAVSPFTGMGNTSTSTTSPNPNYSSGLSSLIGLGLINQFGGQGLGVAGSGG